MSVNGGTWVISEEHFEQRWRKSYPEKNPISGILNSIGFLRKVEEKVEHNFKSESVRNPEKKKNLRIKLFLSLWIFWDNNLFSSFGYFSGFAIS